MYLFARFRVHDEDFDLSSNSNWLKVRTTVSVNNSKKQFMRSRSIPMSASSYYDKLEMVFQHFGYNVSHVVHFGRSCAPVLLEFAEVLVTLIEQLGNWRHTTYNKAYSLNMPWDALRAAAGFRKEKGYYRLPRNQLAVPVALKALVFPNVERARKNFSQMTKQQRFFLPMSEKFLAVMDHLAGVFVQDICQMRCQGRDSHQLYSDPFFQEPVFLDFEHRFKEVFAFHSNPVNDPTFDPIKRAAPLIGHHLGDLKGITHQGFKALNHQVAVLHQQNETLSAAMTQQLLLSQHMYHVIGSAVHAGHAALTGSPLRAQPNVTPVMNSPTRTPCHTETVTRTTATPVVQGISFPEFDRLSYDSIEMIYNDWFGEDDSPFAPHGGVKNLYENKQWRKSLGNNPSKREADKKMLQKMKRIGTYMENYISNNKTKDLLVSHLRQMVEESPKSSETLTGIDKLIQDGMLKKINTTN